MSEVNGVKRLVAMFENPTVRNEEQEQSGTFNNVHKVSKENGFIRRKIEEGQFGHMTGASLIRNVCSVPVKSMYTLTYGFPTDEHFLNNEEKVSVDLTHLYDAEFEWDDTAVDIDEAELRARDAISLEWDDMSPAQPDSEALSDVDMFVDDATLEAIAEALTGGKKLAKTVDDSIIRLGENVSERIIVDHCTVAATEEMTRYTQELLQDGADLDFVTLLENGTDTDKEHAVMASSEPVAQTKAKRHDEHIARYRGNVKRLVQQFEGRGI